MDTVPAAVRDGPAAPGNSGIARRDPLRAVRRPAGHPPRLRWALADAGRRRARRVRARPAARSDEPDSRAGKDAPHRASHARRRHRYTAQHTRLRDQDRGRRRAAPARSRRFDRRRCARLRAGQRSRSRLVGRRADLGQAGRRGGAGARAVRGSVRGRRPWGAERGRPALVGVRRNCLAGRVRSPHRHRLGGVQQVAVERRRESRPLRRSGQRRPSAGVLVATGRRRALAPAPPPAHRNVWSGDAPLFAAADQPAVNTDGDREPSAMLLANGKIRVLFRSDRSRRAPALVDGVRSVSGTAPPPTQVSSGAAHRANPTVIAGPAPDGRTWILHRSDANVPLARVGVDPPPQIVNRVTSAEPAVRFTVGAVRERRSG